MSKTKNDGISYQITKRAVDKLKGKVSEDGLKLLRKHEGTSCGHTLALESLMKRAGLLDSEDREGTDNAKFTNLKNAFLDNWSAKNFNSLGNGETHEVGPGMRIRRVPGGFAFEYFKTTKTAGQPEEETVTAAFFVSTDELRHV